MKLFDSDGDATNDFEKFLDDIERQVYVFMQRRVDEGASKIELRAALERILNVTSVSALTVIVNVK